MSSLSPIPSLVFSTVSERPAAPKSDTVQHSRETLTPRRPSSAVWACVLPVVAGLMIRVIVGFFWLGGTELHNDAADYYSEATKVASGTREATPFYWPPANSYYLAGWFALFGASVTIARVAMIVLSTAQIAVVSLLTFEATRSRNLTILAAWLAALYPPAILLVAQPYSQHLAGVALTVIAWCGIKWLKTQSMTWLALLGLSVGVGCLTRPSMMSVLALCYLAVLVMAAVRSGPWWKRATHAIAPCLLLSLTAGLVLAPIILHNARCGGGYSLSTNNERNFFLGNNPHTPWYKTSHFAQRSIDELPPEVQDYLKSYYDAPNRRTAMKQAALRHVMENPALAALRSANRARAFWGFDYVAMRAIQATTDVPSIVSAALLLTEAGGYFAVMVFALLGLLHGAGPFRRVAIVWYLAVIAAYAGPYCLAFSGGTYHFPVMGIILPFAAVGVSTLWQQGWRATLSPTRVWSVLLIFTAMQVEYAYFTLAAGVSGEPRSIDSTGQK